VAQVVGCLLYKLEVQTLVLPKKKKKKETKEKNYKF
jgi:hypothetical protein